MSDQTILSFQELPNLHTATKPRNYILNNCNPLTIEMLLKKPITNHIHQHICWLDICPHPTKATHGLKTPVHQCFSRS